MGCTADLPGGYAGHVLLVDLTSGQLETRPLSPGVALEHLGGRGLATRLLAEEMDLALDPLDPDSVLVIATSPLVGTSAPTASRGHMVFRSPLTGCLGSSSCGGSWAPGVKAAGYDALLIRGRARRPVVLDLTPSGAQLLPADGLWGQDTHATTSALLRGQDLRQRVRVLCIGPAGERQVRFATVMNDRNRAYGRSGAGAIWGSKQLKAIRVAGRAAAPVRDQERYRSGLEQARYLMRAAPGTRNLFRELGTAGLVRLIDLIDMLPHRNFQDTRHDPDLLLQVSGERLRDTILERSGACHLCTIACQRHTRVGSRTGEGPEYESLVQLGPCCDVYDLEAIARAGYRCNELGLDTISCGVTIAAAMELAEGGNLETGPLELRFGNGAVLEPTVEAIATRAGVGDRLAEGARGLAESCGLPEVAMTVKGLELPAYDPRASYTQALGYMTSPTGACHLRGGYAVSLAFFGGAREIPRFSLLQSPLAVRNLQNTGILQDSLGICRFTGFAFATEPWVRMVSGVTGEDLGTARLEEIADHIASLERRCNIATGLRAADDTLPVRFQAESIQVGDQPRRVAPETITRLRSDYYKVRGWDAEGRPPDPAR